MIEQLPPNSIEIEQACISCALLSSEALRELKEKVTVEDFYYDKIRTVYNVLITLPTVDLLILKESLQKEGLLDKIGGYAFLVELFEYSASSSNINYYIVKLKDYSRQRKVIAESQDAIQRAYKGENAEEIISTLNTNLKLTEYNTNVYTSEKMFSKDIDSYKLNPKDFLKTGIVGFDERFYGIYNSELFVIAARPGQGKSSIVLNIANHVSQTKGVAFFSLEQPVFFQSIRLLAMESGIDSEIIMHGKLDDRYKYKLIEAYDKLKTRKLFLDDSSGLTSIQIENRTRRLYDKFGLGLIIIDYMQIVKNTSSKDKRLQIGDDLKVFRNLGRELNVPVIALSQLSRKIEERVNKIPVLSDLKESGSLEDDADKIGFLHFPDDDENGTIIIAKNRNGSKGNAPIEFQRAYSKFI